jgi:S-DNA-T family DNA segregation ATPase FtsK/SpoIIIE
VGIGMDGLSLAAMGLLANQLGPYMGLNPGYGTGMAVLGAGLVGLDVYLNWQNKYERLFRNCGLVNKDDKVPLLIKRERKDNMTVLVLHLPEGIAQHHFEDKLQELEQGLNAKIELAYNKNLIMKLTGITLSTMYPYTFEECEKPLEVFCGYSNSGKFTLDLEKCPHVIVSGETDSGKSSLLDSIALSLIFNKHDIDLRFIDFQGVTLGKYEQCKKVKSYGEKPEDFDRLMDELEEENARRLKLFRSVKNKVYIDKLSTWNETFPDRTLPYIVVMIDEYSRICDYEELFEKFRNRAAMDRKTGTHIIASLQRPDVKSIPGNIKANFPVRVAFKAVTKIDSEVILDQPGAENLTVPGRCLIKYGGKIQEVQGLFADPKRDVRKLLKQHNAYKSREEIEADKRADMKKRRDKCINPYLKGAAK